MISNIIRDRFSQLPSYIYLHEHLLKLISKILMSNWMTINKIHIWSALYRACFAPNFSCRSVRSRVTWLFFRLTYVMYGILERTCILKVPPAQFSGVPVEGGHTLWNMTLSSDWSVVNRSYFISNRQLSWKFSWYFITVVKYWKFALIKYH